ncbi:WXG100 family type VII secretion target [Nocardia sp. SYP-A9097]|uniref:WXG100 family type VII secretion target n=1 Tax=Nocardia sp. SYP-A9097 TaxID=2663237 RepID=UPI00129ABE74|nr:hypothetical protein [Nocardia sp. SYP-A9097]
MGDDDNPWLGLDQQARGGTLHLAPGVGQAASKLAADVANSLGIALTYQALLTDHKGFSDNNHLSQVLALKDRFNAQGGRLGDILKRYIDLVEAMADTMIVADRNYSAAEEDSKAMFTRFKKESAIHPASGTPTLVTGTKIPVWNDDSTPLLDGKHGNPDLVKISREKGHYDAIDPEDPKGKDHMWLHLAGAGMNPQLVADIGGTWLTVADKVEKSFAHLVTKLDDIKGSWSGQGGDAARRVAGEFKTEADGLTADVRAMASNLNYVSGWLDHTKAQMPNAPTDFDYDHPAREERILNAARLAFQRWYVTGLIAAGPAIPKLVDPLAQLPGVAPVSYSFTGGGPTSTNPNQFAFKSATPPADGFSMSRTDPNSKNPQSIDPSKNNPGNTDPGKNDPNGTQGKNDPSGTPGKNDPGKTDPSKTGPNSTDPSQNNSQNTSNGTSQQSSNGSTDASQLTSALQGLTSNQAKTNDPSSTLAGIPNLLSNLSKDLAKGGGPGGGGPGVSPASAPKELTSRLFPRAALSAEIEGAITTSARAGIATAGASPMGGGMGGSPMGGGHGAGGQGGQGKEHKRPEFLDSTEYLEEAMGAAPIVAKPVVEG